MYETTKINNKEESTENITYIFTISPSSNTVSSLASGEKWQTVLFTEMQVGKATPLSIFLLTFLYTFPVCLNQFTNNPITKIKRNPHPKTNFMTPKILMNIYKDENNYILSDKVIAFFTYIYYLGFRFAFWYHQSQSLCKIKFFFLCTTKTQKNKIKKESKNQKQNTRT